MQYNPLFYSDKIFFNLFDYHLCQKKFQGNELVITYLPILSGEPE